MCRSSPVGVDDTPGRATCAFSTVSAAGSVRPVRASRPLCTEKRERFVDRELLGICAGADVDRAPGGAASDRRLDRRRCRVRALGADGTDHDRSGWWRNCAGRRHRGREDKAGGHDGAAHDDHPPGKLASPTRNLALAGEPGTSDRHRELLLGSDSRPSAPSIRTVRLVGSRTYYGAALLVDVPACALWSRRAWSLNVSGSRRIDMRRTDPEWRRRTEG